MRLSPSVVSARHFIMPSSMPPAVVTMAPICLCSQRLSQARGNEVGGVPEKYCSRLGGLGGPASRR